MEEWCSYKGVGHGGVVFVQRGGAGKSGVCTKGWGREEGSSYKGVGQEEGNNVLCHFINS